MKRNLTAFLVLCLSLCGVYLAASPGGHAFNTSTGSLNVDYAAYLSKNDVVFNSPITTKVNGLTFANGRVGAQVWSSNGLSMQVTGVDNAQQTCFSSGIVNLYTNPGMDSGYSTFQQRLNIYDGTITVTYDSNRTVTFMGSPSSEVLGIHVEDNRSGVSSVTLDVSIWDLAGLPSSSTSMYLDVPDMNTWKTVSTYNDSSGAGISRGQSDANRFGYTLAASVEGASFSTSKVNNNMVRLTITPTSSYTIWIANATRLNASNNDSVTQARNLLSGVKNTGYSTTLANFTDWWHSYWKSSFVQYSNSAKDADYLESYYYLANYIIGGGSYANYPFQFIHGAYGAVNDDDSDKWSGGYWYWNERCVYYSMLASNHVTALDGLFNLYIRNYNTIKSHTQSRFGIDGIWVPETMGWDGNARHTDSSTYTDNVFSTGAEISQYMFYRYKYTNDSSWLSRIYPMMREVCKFYSSKLTLSGGKYIMESSNCHEQYWDVKNAIVDLAAVRAMFPMAIEASTILGQDSSLRSTWQNVLNNLAPYRTDSNTYLPCDDPIPGTHNVENVICEMIWPYGVTGIGYPDQSRANYAWNNRPNNNASIWSPDAVQAARLGMGDNAFNSMKAHLGKYQSYPNGLTSNTNGNYEFVGLQPSAMNESLLQSYNDKIRVFPALPNDSSFVGKFTLLAKGGFLVSSEKEGSDIKYVGIKSLYGNSATVVNPWGTQQVQVRRASDSSIVTTSSSSELTFATSSNTVYVIERTSKLLGSYTYEQLSGSPNQGVKSLSGTSCSLGSGTYSGPTSTPTSVPTATPTAVPACSLKGDVNGNGSVDIVDALLIAQSYVGLNPSGFNAMCADTNCSGAIDIVDALLIAQYYVGLISQLC